MQHGVNPASHSYPIHTKLYIMLNWVFEMCTKCQFPVSYQSSNVVHSESTRGIILVTSISASIRPLSMTEAQFLSNDLPFRSFDVIRRQYDFFLLMTFSHCLMIGRSQNCPNSWSWKSKFWDMQILGTDGPVKSWELISVLRKQESR